MKILFFLLDGLPEMGKYTPLSSARKPNMDSPARYGRCGEMLLVPKSRWDEKKRGSVSHLALLSLLGYRRSDIKRGPVEAIGAEVEYRNGWLALRCNFATVDESGIVVDRRAERRKEGLDEIVRDLNEIDVGVDFLLKRTYYHRAVLLFKKEMSDEITDSDPYVVGEKPRMVEGLSKNGEKSARVVNDFLEKARKVMESHNANEERRKKGILPANCLLVREAGNHLPRFRSFREKYGIRKAVCVAENGVVKGLCSLFGFDVVTIPETGLERSIDFVFDTVNELINEYEVVRTHIKWTDEPAHDRDFFRKQRVIEKIDEKMKEFLRFDGVVVVTSDHITSSRTGRHEFGPAPLLVYGKGRDEVKRFDEVSVKKGSLKFRSGGELWRFLVEE